MFGVPIDLYMALLFISLIFFIITAIPTIVLTELGIRGSVALFLFGLYFKAMHQNIEQLTIGILSSITFLWLINLCVPALLGTIFTFRLKFFRRNLNGNGA